ncbi:natterin-3-like [Perca flavescens]|uniref:natterin-3-like n=1 Tax=Perca flavescens TaxID=8167 RepID=UPI00106EC53A|nr:natterin-3-like [Perca flavescens]
MSGLGERAGSEHNLAMYQSNLEWQNFNGSLPNGAVSIHNGYEGRTDYVAKYGSTAGFYNPDKGPYCFYPYCWKEHRGSPFQILVNKNNLDLLQWKDGSNGSVPPNAVQTCPGSGIYVGKNQYGLGKVDVENQSFYYPWGGKEYKENSYQVLTFIYNYVISENISVDEYTIDGVKPIQYPPEIMDTSPVLTNNDCRSVKRTTTLEKTIQKEQRWDTSFPFTEGIKCTVTAGIPKIMSIGIELGTEKTLQFTKGTTHTESTTHAVSVEAGIPPNYSCRVIMVGYKYGADIPFTAKLTRTYRYGQTFCEYISGTYKSVQMGEVRGVVDRCEPIPDPKPCPLKKE